MSRRFTNRSQSLDRTQPRSKVQNLEGQVCREKVTGVIHTKFFTYPHQSETHTVETLGRVDLETIL